MDPRTRRIIMITASALVVLIGGGYLVWSLMSSMIVPSENTNIANYASTLKQWKPSGLARHFPASIPAQAQGVRFAAFPRFLQGGAYVQLRMQLPASQIQQIDAQLRQSAPANLNPHPTVPSIIFFRTSGAGVAVFPANFTLYVLTARERASPSWNHGDACGVAVSTTTNEVVYWADSW